MTIAEIDKPDPFEIGGYLVPMGKPVIKGYRRGTPFWEIARNKGVPTTALLIPVTYPPDTNAEAMLAGMGVPDVAGTNGTFSFYTSEVSSRTTVEGGRIIRVRVKGKLVRTALRGPRNEYIKGTPYAEIPFEVAIDGPDHITIRMEEEVIAIRVGDWSPWIHLRFHVAPTIEVRAIATSKGISAGMGVPDVAGTNGTFSFYTSEVSSRTTVEGGRIIRVRVKGKLVRTALRGPRNEYIKGTPYAEIPFEVAIDGPDHITIRMEEEVIAIRVGDWSPWIHLRFHLAPTIEVRAIAKFYLKSVSKTFQLYVSPVNFDPAAPAVPITYPESYSKELAERIGPFYTQGMPEDTWALNEERISDKAFLDQVGMIQKERTQLFFSELQRLKRGILSAVFVSPDRIQHMFWRERDANHPLYQIKSVPGRSILQVYQHVNGILTRILKYIDEKTVLIVLSDHGFTSFNRAVHLNSWLIREGFMQLKVPLPETTGPFFENVDWSQTQAFAMGLSGLWLNVKGREKSGIVESEEIATLKYRLGGRLTLLTDPATEKRVIRRVFDRDRIYRGAFEHNAPDLVIGYESGYRSSWQTVLGAAPESLFGPYRIHV